MYHFRKESTGLFFGLFAILAAGFLYQLRFMTHPDVSWDLMAAERLMAHGTYSLDFFDLNPPLILYILTVPVWMTHVFGLDLNIALLLYVFALSACSLALCGILVRRVAGMWEPGFLSCVLISLAAVFTLLPGNHIGEREQFLVVFGMPWFWLVYARLTDTPIKPVLAGLIGLFAAFGFALKPHFLLAPVLLECWLLWRTRSLRCWLRPEVGVLAGFVILYAGFVLVFHADYLTRVVPMAMDFYYAGYSMPWWDVVSRYPAVYCLVILAALFWCMRDRYLQRRETALYEVLFFALMAYLLAYISQQTYWFYRVLPAFSVAALATVLLCFTAIQQTPTRKYQVWVFGVMLALPMFFVTDQMGLGLAYARTYQPIIDFLIHDAQKDPVYFLTADARTPFPAVQYGHANYASRMMHLFWVPGYATKSALTTSEKRHEAAFVRLVTDDLQTRKPRWILVDTKPFKTSFNGRFFDYMDYFDSHSEFRQYRESCHPVKTLQYPEPSADASGWDLYQAHRLADIDTQRISGSALLVIGQGNVRKLYYLQNGQWMTALGKPAHERVRLPSGVRNALSDVTGKAVPAVRNRPEVERFVQKHAQFPYWRLQVYRCAG